MSQRSRLMRWWLVGIGAVIVVVAVLAVPLARAAARNVAALQTKPIVQTVDWTDPAVMCTPAAPPPTIEVPACDAGDACYLNAVIALRRGEWNSAQVQLESSTYILDIFVRGWAAMCDGSDQSGVTIWQHAANPISKKFLTVSERAIREANPKSALQTARIANEIAPSTSTYFALGRAYDLLEDVPHAREFYRVALGRGDATASMFFQAGYLEWRLGDLRAALPLFARAVQLGPDNWDAWHHYGSVLYRLGEWTSAEDAYAHAVRLNPTFEHSNAGLALAQLQQGKLQTAQLSIERTVTYTYDIKQRIGYLAEFAKILTAQGQYASAASMYEQALAVAPENSWVAGMLIQTYIKLGDCTRALALQSKYTPTQSPAPCSANP